MAASAGPADPRNTTQRGLQIASLFFGGLTLALGLLVIFGWYTGNATLVQVMPGFVPMQYNTAAGFVLCGAGLLLLASGMPRAATVAGGLAVLVGTLTLVQYVFGVDLRIDELFMEHDITTATSNPGRMAPNTAMCFTLLGLGLVVRGRWGGTTGPSVPTVLLGSLAFGLAFVALSGYATGLETAYGWGNLTRMAVHTAVGFLLGTVGLIAFVSSSDSADASGLPRWLPVPLGVGTMTATLSLWQALEARAVIVAKIAPELGSLSNLATLVLVAGMMLALALALAARFGLEAARRTREVAHSNEALQAQVEVRRRAQQELQAHRDNLELVVAERTEDLEQARKDAESANRAKSTFLANMSHELRTPLNAVIGYSEMLAEELEEEGQDSYIPDLRRINASGKHLLSLINDVLDLSKIEAGKMDLYLEHFDVKELLDEVAAAVEPLVGKKGNTLVVDAPGDVGTMHADQTKVRQALFNLLSNAAKFTERGTITLAAWRDDTPGGDRVHFDVRDSGIGIPAERLDGVFEEFRQADSSTTRHYGGTGLGLPISRRFCQMMGGDVTATSEAGVGSTFSIDLPAEVVAPKDAAGDATNARDEADGAGEAESVGVLVIDDDPNARDLLSRIVESDGYSVAVAANGTEGIEMARRLHPDVITLDVMMPDLDGWSVLRALKAEPETQHIPVIMVTVVPESGSIGTALGAAEYLPKPVERKTLLELVARHVDARGLALIVDDEEASRTLARRWLEGAGWDVVEAENGARGLERIAEREPDLVLLDLMMPVMDGFEFMERLRSDDGERDIPVIVLTAKELSADERSFLDARTRKVIQKGPQDREALLDLLRRSAGKKRSGGDATPE